MHPQHTARIIGILGRSRVGKDSVARVFMAMAGEGAVLTRLSQPLKDAARVLYGFDDEQVEGDKKEKIDARYGITPRIAIQTLTDQMMRSHGERFFTDRLYDRIQAMHPLPRTVIIPDVRYAHDIEEIHRRGGVVVKVTRPFHPNVPLHAWEAQIEGLQGDLCIQNRGSLDRLHREAYLAWAHVINQSARSRS